MRIHIGYIPSRIIVVFVAIFHPKRFACCPKVPVHWEINHTELRIFAIVWSMIRITIQKGIIRIRQRLIIHIIFTLLISRVDVGMITFLTFHHNNIIPRSLTGIPRIIFAFFPCVVEWRAVLMVAIHHIAFTRADFCIHKKVATITFGLVLLC